MIRPLSDRLVDLSDEPTFALNTEGADGLKTASLSGAHLEAKRRRA